MGFSLWKPNTWGREIPGDMIGALTVASYFTGLSKDVIKVSGCEWQGCLREYRPVPRRLRPTPCQGLCRMSFQSKRTGSRKLSESFQLQNSMIIPITCEQESKRAKVINCVHLCILPFAISLLTCGERRGGYLVFFTLISSQEARC